MGYINFRTGKIKTSAGMGVARSHNQREAFCDNADPSRKWMNKQIMPCVPNYDEFFRERIASSPLYQGKKQPRADAVRALDLEFRVNAEEMDENPRFDLDEFCRITKEWVCETFGAENVADLVLHMDEGYGEHGGSLKCAPHIHAVVVPMIQDGRLSAAEFIGSPKKLQAMQSEVAERYKSIGLKRGMQGSVARHNEMKDFYGWVHAARIVNLPEPGEHETARQYAARVRPELQKMQSQQLGDLLRVQRERDEAQTRVKQLTQGKNIGEDELKRAREELEKRERELRDREQMSTKDRSALQQWRDVLQGLGLAGLSADERQAFMQVAEKALEAGRTARENAEREAEEIAAQNGVKTETK